MIKVYIASPYTTGDVAVNVKRQLDTADELLALGYCPYIPLLCHFVHMAHPRGYEDWMAYVDEWITCCDVMLRLPGASPGADREVSRAKSLHIPVVKTINTLRKRFPTASN